MGKGDKSHLATGEHGRETFVRVFFALYKRQRNGVLNIRFGKSQRSILIMNGEPVGYRSDLPEEDIGRTLVNAKLIPEKQMKWIREKLSEGEVLEEAIVMSGALTKDDLKDHKNTRMKIGVGSPLLWGSGEWEFSPRPRIQPGQIDPKLLAKTNTLAALPARTLVQPVVELRVQRLEFVRGGAGSATMHSAADSCPSATPRTP